MSFNLRGGRPKNMNQSVYWIQRATRGTKKTKKTKKTKVNTVNNNKEWKPDYGWNASYGWGYFVVFAMLFISALSAVSSKEHYEAQLPPQAQVEQVEKIPTFLKVTSKDDNFVPMKGQECGMWTDTNETFEDTTYWLLSKRCTDSKGVSRTYYKWGSNNIYYTVQK